MSDQTASQLLTLRDADACRWDCVALGEVMLRFDPGPGRIRAARRFDVYEGGGEYNAVRALRKGFGQRTAILTALPDNELGRLGEDLILQGGVDVSQSFEPFRARLQSREIRLCRSEIGFRRR